MMPSPVNLSTVPPYRVTTSAERSTNSVMISRSRSAPTAAAMSIEWTTSANSTVTCLYSADRLTSVTGAPHSLQNLALGTQRVPHDPQDGRGRQRAGTSALSSTSVSCHRRSDMSAISHGDAATYVLPNDKPPPAVLRSAVPRSSCIGKQSFSVIRGRAGHSPTCNAATASC